MDGPLNNLNHDQDIQTSKATQPDDVEEFDDLSIRNKRLARIDEYEDSAAARQNPYEAIIGTGSADLQRIFEHLAKAVVDTIEAGSKSIEEIRLLTPDIRLLVKIRAGVEADMKFHSPDEEQEFRAIPHRPERGDINGRAINHSKRAIPRR